MAKILVVEDSLTDRKIILTALAQTGHHIITAENGDEALQKAVQEHPNLILLDVVLPNQNGFQVCRQLKADTTTQDIKIILVTSKNQKSDRFWGLKQGADAYLTKPFEDQELLDSIARCL